jgi:hypothetical protein
MPSTPTELTKTYEAIILRHRPWTLEAELPGLIKICVAVARHAIAEIERELKLPPSVTMPDAARQDLQERNDG